MWYRGDASITQSALDSSNLVRQPLGLDFTLAGETFGQFSSIEVERVITGLGFNYQPSDSLVWNTQGQYGNFSDLDPYLYDTTGKKFTVYTGVMLLW
jgi:hypothetical protein